MIKLATLILLLSYSFAQAAWDGQIFSPVSKRFYSLSDITATVGKGTVLVVSEEHDSVSHHQKQLTLLKSLKAFGHKKISVGWEFLDHTQQPDINEYLKGETNEQQFLNKVKMKPEVFNLYRDIFRFPVDSEMDGWSFGLNIPRSISSKIAKIGYKNLTPEDAAQLPPDFELGNSDYRERFVEAMGGHGQFPPDVIQKYFEAQCSWDDTMAYSSKRILETVDPDQILVVIVGNFHAEFGGGLPDRLAKRGVSKVVVITQLTADKYSESELRAAINLHSKYGKRGDFVWISGEPHQ